MPTAATQISPAGKGYIQTPGIHTEAQAAAWKRVTDAVHEAGGKIVVQLWHVGRISHTSLQPDGQAPVGSLLIMEFEDLAAARAFAQDDPFAKAGLFQSVDIRPWRKTFPAGCPKSERILAEQRGAPPAPDHMPPSRPPN